MSSLDDQQTQLAEELREGRFALWLCVICAGLSVAGWQFAEGGIKLLAVLIGLVAVYGLAKAHWHFASYLCLKRLNNDVARYRMTVVFVLTAVVAPATYYVLHAHYSFQQLGEKLISGWLSLAAVAFIGYISFIVVQSMKPIVEVRPYLAAIYIVTVLAASSGLHLSSNEDESYDDEPMMSAVDRSNLALTNFVRYGIAAFVGITIGLRLIQRNQ